MGYIYLIQIDNTNHYKLGKTKNFDKRITNYKNLIPTVILQVYTDNHDKDEKELLKIFNQNFENVKERGKEYYKGDCEVMKNLIHNYFNKTKTSITPLNTTVPSRPFLNIKLENETGVKIQTVSYRQHHPFIKTSF